MKHWPTDLSKEISFAHGAVPLHEYLRIQAGKLLRRQLKEESDS